MVERDKDSGYADGREAWYEGEPLDTGKPAAWQNGWKDAKANAEDDLVAYEPSDDYDSGRYDDDPSPYDGNYSEE